MLSTVVKISNVTNLSDARYCAGMGVEMLGFALDADNPHYVDPQKFKEIRSWIAGVQLVGETRTDDPEEIFRLLGQYPVDALQVSLPAMIPFLVSRLKIPVLLQLDIDQMSSEDVRATLSDYGTAVASVLLESSQNSPVTPEWEHALLQMHGQDKILLGFGLESVERIQQLIQLLPVSGISLKGSDELRPGYKDYGMLMDILEALETE
jgi:phosphoribosylanthranilate isomerase